MSTRESDVTPAVGSDDVFNGRKRKRNARACDRCHKNACKCTPGNDGASCARCSEHGVQCTYNRPHKRRGPPPRRSHPIDDSQLGSPSVGNALSDGANPATYAEDTTSAFYAPYEDSINPRVIESLVDVFYYAGYPLRPYFHWPTYYAQVREQLYRYDWGNFVVTMAVCALASGQLHDGISISSEPHPLRSEAINLFATSYDAALNAIPKDIATVTDQYSLMKGKAILASACLQNGQLKRAIAHGGDYISLCMNTGFHDESNWPVDLSEAERQERRRLFWGVYQHEQYIANNFGFMPRQRQAMAKVSYPAEIFDDEDVSLQGIQHRSEGVSFLQGWNFCTDMYRLLENMDSLLRKQSQTMLQDEPGGAVTSFLSQYQPPKHFSSDTLHLISKLYDDLPNELKQIKEMTGDPQLDRYGFISANILITTQTLKMILVGDGKPSVHLRCAIATELLDELSTIPLAFFHASSTTTLNHLAHVGHILAGVIQNSVSPWNFVQVRNILLVLAEFLAKIESTRISSPGLAAKLQSQIKRIDQCMQQSSQRNSGSGLLSIGEVLLSGWPNDRLLSPLSNGQYEQPAPQTNELTAGSSQNTHPLDQYNNGFRVEPDLMQQPRIASSSSTFRALHQDPELFGNTLFDTPRTSSAPLSNLSMMAPQSNQSLFPDYLFDSWPFFRDSMDQTGSANSIN